MGGCLARRLGRTPPAASGSITWLGAKVVTLTNAAGTTNVLLNDLLDSAGSPITLLQDDFVLINAAYGRTTDVAYSDLANSWLKRNEHYANGSSHDPNQAVWYKHMGGSPDASVDITSAGGAGFGGAATLHAFRGVNLSTPFDVADVLASATGNTNVNAGAITPTTAGAFIIVAGAGAHGNGAGTAFTQGGDLESATNAFLTLSVNQTNDVTVGTGFKDDWTSGAFDPAAWTGPTAAGGGWTAITMALRPA